MLYTLRQLEIFLSIARTQNISKAADHLCMSQSAASAALQQLEQQFDVQLFDRNGKTLSLSKTGSAVRAKAQALMDQATDFQLQLQDSKQTGHLSIGASLTIGNYLGVTYYSQYLALYPQAQTTFAIANSPEILQKVLNFDIDIGLVESEIQHRDLTLIPWRQDKLLAFCSPNHALANKKTLTDTDIKQARWIVREANSGTRQTFDRGMQGLLPKLDIFLELDHNEAIKRAVEANIGIGCMSEIALATNFKNGDLIPLALENRPMQRTFYFVVNKNRPKTQAIQQWMDLCQRPLPSTTDVAS